MASKHSSYEAILRNDEELRIVMVGKTGIGKSATGNTILGHECFESKFSATSMTDECFKAKAEVDGQKVVVIDTPGLFDTRWAQDKTHKDMKQCICYSSPGPHVFLVVVMLGRFTEEEKQSVQKIQEIFGQDADKYSMVLFTHGDRLKDTTIEEFMEDSPDLQGLVSRCNGQYHVFNNELENCSQVTELLKKIRSIVQKNGGSHYTNEMFQKAERAIEEEKQRILREKEEQIRKEKEELEKKLRVEYEEKIKNMMEKFQAEIEEEHRKREMERTTELKRSKEGTEGGKKENKGKERKREEKMKTEKEIRGEGEKELKKEQNKLDKKNLTAARQEEAILRNDEEMRIVIVGKTGIGKSATGNTILGRKCFESKFSATSITDECFKAKAEVDGQMVVVIDTPGLFNTRWAQGKTHEDIKQCIRYSSPGPHVFLVVVMLDRFTEEEKQSVQKIQEIFGQDADKYCMVLFTHGDLLIDTTLVEFMKNSPDLQGLVSRCNGQYHVFNNGLENHLQVTELLKKIRSIVQKNGGSHYTNEMFQKAERAIEEEKQRNLREKEEQIRKEKEEVEKKLRAQYDEKMKKITKKFQDEMEEERRKRSEQNTKKMMMDMARNKDRKKGEEGDGEKRKEKREMEKRGEEDRVGEEKTGEEQDGDEEEKRKEEKREMEKREGEDRMGKWKKGEDRVEEEKREEGDREEKREEDRVREEKIGREEGDEEEKRKEEKQQKMIQQLKAEHERVLKEQIEQLEEKHERMAREKAEIV